MARQFPVVVASVGIASALFLLAVPPAVAAPTQPQTVAFTSDTPQGATWFGDGNWSPDYYAVASASSGLPVSYSIDPASAAVCEIDDRWGSASAASIDYLGPGTCTIRADQAGNEQYLPAPQASQSFAVDKVQPMLAVLKQTNWPSRKRTFRATLVIPVAWNHYGYHSGQVVTFSVGGRPACSGTTGDNGIATCTANLSVRDQLRFPFTAFYAGDPRYKSVARNGPTAEVKDPVQAEPW